MEGIKYEDPNRLGLIRDLKKEGKKKAIWARLAEDLDASRKNRSEVNIEKINKLTKAKESVVVAGKVLGSGDLEHAVTVAAFKFSSSAKEKIENAGGKAISIDELVKKDPKGSNIRILK